MNYLQYFVLVNMLFYSSLLSTTIDTKAFVVSKTSKTRASKNSLKEDLGFSMKSALHACAALNKELGALQQKIASLQTQLLNNIESLIENKKKFKRAKRWQLHDALMVMTKAEGQLKRHKQDVCAMNEAINKDGCLAAG